MIDVDFIIAGVQKAGTTTVMDMLRSRDDFFVSTPKELHFFDDRRPVQPALARRYNRYFAGARPDQTRGEATPIYSFYPGCLDKIRAYSDRVRIVILLRDPVERSYSQYWHEYRHCWETLPFARAIQRRPRTPRDEVYVRHHSYIERSCYTGQIARARALFGPDRVKVIALEDLIADRTRVFNDLVGFLRPGARPAAAMPLTISNSAHRPRLTALHLSIARLHLAAGRRVVPRRLTDLNLREERYPAMSGADWRQCRDLLLAQDPDLVTLYPALARG